jgi:hypothetical protein
MSFWFIGFLSKEGFFGVVFLLPLSTFNLFAPFDIFEEATARSRQPNGERTTTLKDEYSILNLSHKPL